MTNGDAFVSVLKFAIATGILGFLGRSLFGQFLSRDIEQFKTKLSTSHAAEVERLKADLRTAAFEHETRFGRLHEKRIEIIAELYKRLAIAYDALTDILNPIQFGGKEDHVRRIHEAPTKVNEFFKYFGENRIYFDESLSRLVDTLRPKFFAAWHPFMHSPEKPPAREWNEAWNAFTQEVPPLLAEIEKQVRQMLGVADKA